MRDFLLAHDFEWFAPEFDPPDQRSTNVIVRHLSCIPWQAR